jgi:threonine/homoserine/homoserine lactone efflux protein
MSLNILIAFWGVSILFVMTPGIDWAYAISSGIQGKRVLPAVTGLLTGHLMAALIVAAGVGTLVTSQPVLLQVLTGAGAVYLLWMGLSLSMRPASISSDNVAIASSKSWYIRGVYLSGLNPKVLLLFSASSATLLARAAADAPPATPPTITIFVIKIPYGTIN